MMDRADPSLTSWLSERATDGGTGFDVAGWEGTAWILHRIYERIGVSDTATWDERRKRQIATGLIQPQMVGDVDLDEGTTSTGIPLGGRGEPTSDWKRLSWAELARRLGVTFADTEYPPCHKWFPYRSWPERIAPPTEGSMERADLRDLIDVLSIHSRAGLETPCLCLFAPLASRKFPQSFYEPDLRVTTLGDALDIYDEDEQSPNNIWPDDRSWFVYTDWDLQGTKVSGTTALIAALIGEPRLETITGPW